VERHNSGHRSRRGRVSSDPRFGAHAIWHGRDFERSFRRCNRRLGRLGGLITLAGDRRGRGLEVSRPIKDQNGAARDVSRGAEATPAVHRVRHALAITHSRNGWTCGNNLRFFVPPMPCVTIGRIRATYIFAGKVSLSQCRPCRRASVPKRTSRGPHPHELD
jgi:hypothetical protein